MKQFFLPALLLFFAALAGAQPYANRSNLRIEDFMQGERFTGFSPDNVFWSDDSKTVYFTWNPDQDTLRSLYKVNVDGGKPAELTVEEERGLARGGVYDRAYSRKLFARNGDIFLLDIAAGQERAITQTVAGEFSPRFSGDESQVIYQSGDNLFAWDMTTGATLQLTQFLRGAKREEPRKSAQEQWLEEDQLALFEILRERKAETETRRLRTKALEPKRPKEFYYGEKSLANIQISPDLRFVSFRLTTRAKTRQAQMPDYVTPSGFATIEDTRTKVGAAQDTHEAGIYDRERDTVYFISTKTVEGIFDKPEFLAEYHRDTTPYNNRYDKPREVFLSGPVFSDDGKAAVVLRSQDSKDRWIMLLDLESGALKLLDRQRDEAWIGGPGTGGWTGAIGWMPDNRRLWFQSEASGYSHLYTVDVESGEQVALTQGKFEVLSAELSRNKDAFFITANAEGPHEHHFYRLPLNGGKLEKITPAKGGNRAFLSPDEKQIAVLHSFSNKPWELHIMENKAGAPMRQVTESTTEAFRKYPWRVPEIVWFTARDGVQVPARLYRPAKAGRGGPAVIFVHGAGYLQNVHHWWSSYSREFMFHNFLADNGYTVLDIDFRASAGYGRDWRTAIYRHMGGKDLSDQVDGARFLASRYGVNPKRIGIYGGSYGGFITLMALFTEPGVFRSGAALRSVTDWAHYNHPYTANILNTPQEDSLAYRRSSPIYHAEGLKDELLILHGMIDSNVHFQDVVRLSQRLIELGKDNWEMAVFPLEDHGFVTPSSWSDEYKRIYKLFERTLKQ
ncbi:MAG: prolyl oligopeptidase family serine peptidase [Saprospiraceae bacterium]|nr:prolyl oligopeptidase family serine peptidase [Saprospiraceae bacterium]